MSKPKRRRTHDRRNWDRCSVCGGNYTRRGLRCCEKCGSEPREDWHPNQATYEPRLAEERTPQVMVIRTH